MNWKNSFNSNSINNFSYSYCAGNSFAVFFGNNYSFKNLNSFFVAFFYFLVYFNCIARP